MWIRRHAIITTKSSVVFIAMTDGPLHARCSRSGVVDVDEENIDDDEKSPL